MNPIIEIKIFIEDNFTIFAVAWILLHVYRAITYQQMYLKNYQWSYIPFAHVFTEVFNGGSKGLAIATTFFGLLAAWSASIVAIIPWYICYALLQKPIAELLTEDPKEVKKYIWIPFYKYYFWFKNVFTKE